MGLAWPEKFAALIALFFALALICFGAVLNGASTSYDWVEAAGEIELHMARVVLLPLWMVLRVLDLLTGGPSRRRQRRVMVVRPPTGL